MTTSIAVSVHVNPAELGHEHTPTYSALYIGDRHGWPRVDVFFREPGHIDQVIAELVALRAEMEPPAPDDTWTLTAKGHAAAEADKAGEIRGEDGPCMMAGCGHDCNDHSLDLERGDRLYCQRCECRRYLSAAAMRTAGPPYASEGIDGLRWDNMSSSGSAS